MIHLPIVRVEVREESVQCFEAEVTCLEFAARRQIGRRPIAKDEADQPGRRELDD